MEAYVLVHADVGKAGEVAEAIRSLPGVSRADTVTGPYDVVVRVDAPGERELDEDVLPTIQALRWVIRAVPCPIWTGREIHLVRGSA